MKQSMINLNKIVQVKKTECKVKYCTVKYNELLMYNVQF